MSTWNWSLTVILLLLSLRAEGAANQTIEVWIRGAGSHADGREVKPVRTKKINLTKLKSKEVQRYDVQYNKEMKYRGVGLRQVLGRFAAGKSDLALLHFTNGMMVPVDLKGRDPFGAAEVFIALQVHQNGKWSDSFPEVAKEDTIRYRRDPLPITFKENKVVLLRPRSSLEVKSKDGKTMSLFTPFSHTTSLRGIEFARSKPYYRQFLVDNTPEADAGLKVFRDRCQFCHGVQKVGAVFGWDYVTPIKISEKRNPRGLHQLVKYPKADPIASGTQMPSQSDISPTESANLWRWIKAVGDKPLKPYSP